MEEGLVEKMKNTNKIKDKEQLISDLGFILFFILVFITIVFVTDDQQHYFQNLIMLNLTFLLVIITYFTTLTLGFVLDGVIILSYISYVLYRSLVLGEIINGKEYFWVIMIPLFTFTINLYASNVLLLQKKINQLDVENKNLATVDSDTGLRNLRTFNNDAKIFMGMSMRGQIKLTLMIVKFRHYKEMRRIIGEEKHPLFMKKITDIMINAMRIEDSLYLIDKKDITFAIFVITDKEGSKIVEKRIKNEVEQQDFMAITDPYDIAIDLQIGKFECRECKGKNKEDIITPLAFIEKAKKEMEYDVG